jgi:hypothetical protein
MKVGDTIRVVRSLYVPGHVAKVVAVRQDQHGMPVSVEIDNPFKRSSFATACYAVGDVELCTPHDPNTKEKQ